MIIRLFFLCFALPCLLGFGLLSEEKNFLSVHIKKKIKLKSNVESTFFILVFFFIPGLPVRFSHAEVMRNTEKNLQWPNEIHYILCFAYFEFTCMILLSLAVFIIQ